MDIDREIIRIQKSARTLLPHFSGIHHHLRRKSPLYYKWHLHPHAHKIHWGALAAYLLVIGIFINSFLQPKIVRAAVVTWDGGGADNNWSTAANWSGDVAPGTADLATFDSTSTKNATIDTNINVDGIDINSGYTGTITQSSGKTITVGTTGGAGWGFDIAAGTFVGGDSAITMTNNAPSFVQSGGTFTSTSGTFQITGNFTRTGGTFNSNNGTVQISAVLAGGTTFTSGGATLYNLDFNNSGAYSIADNFTVTGTLTNSNTGNISNPASTQTITLQGNFNKTAASSGTFGGGNLVLSFSGTSNQTITVSAGTFGADITVDKSSGTVSLASNLTMGTASQDLTLTNGTFSLAGYNLTVNGAGGVFSNNATLRVQGGETLTITMDTDSGTVEYVGDGAGGTTSFNLLETGATDFNNLTINSTAGDETFSANAAAKAMAGTFNVTSGTYTANTQTTTVTGQATVSGGTYTASTATQTFNGGLAISSGTYTGSSGQADVNGLFNQTGGTYTAPTSTTVSGNFTVSSGTFTHNSGTVTLDGTDQTLSGATTFYTFDKTVASAATLTFPASTTIAFASGGTMTLQGASGQLLSLRSSTSGTQAQINPQGTRSVQYLDVKDNTNLNSTVISCTTGCTDSGNNTNWYFGSISAPSNVSATAGDGQVALSWTNPTGSSFASTSIYRSTTSGFTPDNSTNRILSGQTSTSYTDTGLTNGTTYYYVIRAYDTSGGNADASQVSATPQDTTTPSNPSNVSVASGDSQLTLSWTNPTDSDFNGIQIYRSTSSTTIGTLITTTSKTTTSYTDTGLNNSTTYYYTLKAVDTTGNASSGATASGVPESKKTIANPVISEVTVTDIGYSHATINWKTDQATIGQVGWGKKYGTYDKTGTMSTTYTTSHSYTITGLTAGIRYYFRITATNSSKKSTIRNPKDYSFTTLGNYPLASFRLVNVPTNTRAGATINGIVVYPIDTAGNVKENWSGNVWFTSSDSKATLPYTSTKRYTLITKATFNGFIFKTSGGQRLTVTNGSKTGNATINVTATNPVKLAIVAGNNQSQQGGVLATPLQVKVTDTYSNPVSGVKVLFQVTSSPSGAIGSAFSQNPVLTDSSGQASTLFTLGSMAGIYKIKASLPDFSSVASVTFTETSLAFARIEFIPTYTGLEVNGNLNFILELNSSDPALQDPEKNVVKKTIKVNLTGNEKNYTLEVSSPTSLTDKRFLGKDLVLSGWDGKTGVGIRLKGQTQYLPLDKSARVIVSGSDGPLNKEVEMELIIKAPQGTEEGDYKGQLQFKLGGF